MGAKTKFFRVATEGSTTDGRKITRQQIQQMAKNYNPEKYGARMWIEHIRGYHPDSMFSAMGDVLAVKTEEIDGNLVLLAQLDPTDDLIVFNKKRQKIYSSIEIDTDFAGSGEAYLVGLAVTDSPASLGTEMLMFSSTATVNPLASKKQRPENLFSEALEFELELEEGEVEESIGKRLFNKVMGILKPEADKTREDMSAFRDDVATAVEALALAQKELMDKFSHLSADSGLKDEINKLAANVDRHIKEFTALRDALEKEPDSRVTPRPTANGNGSVEETDC